MRKLLYVGYLVPFVGLLWMIVALGGSAWISVGLRLGCYEIGGTPMSSDLRRYEVVVEGRGCELDNGKMLDVVWVVVADDELGPSRFVDNRAVVFNYVGSPQDVVTLWRDTNTLVVRYKVCDDRPSFIKADWHGLRTIGEPYCD